MPQIIKLKNSQTAGNSPALVNTGETGINEADGNFFFRNSGAGTVEKANLRRVDPMFDEIDPYAFRSPTVLQGGGIVSFDGSNVNWSTRFIVISNGLSSRTATGGYFDITLPPNGSTITTIGGSGSVTTSSAGIPISNWQSLYYILPYGSGSTSVPANFRIVNYTASFIIPHTWVPICSLNMDTGILNFNRFSLSPGDSTDTSKSLQSQITGRNAPNQGRSLFFR